MKKVKKCKHNNCTRPSDPTDNNRGFCNKCIQLNTKECNFCLLKGMTDQPVQKKLLEQNIKDVPLMKLVLIILAIGGIGFILGFTIIRLILKSIAGIVLLLLLIVAIYLIIKYFDKWSA